MTDPQPQAPRASLARGALATLLLAAGCAAPEAWEPRPELALTVGGASARGTDALLGGLTASFPIAEHWTVGGRLVAYDFELREEGTLVVDGFELEASQETEGQGLGGGVELRYYPRRALDGFWLGAGALYFPWTDFETRGEARDPLSGAVFTAELESEEVDFVPYGALGWTFRLGGPFSVGLRSSIGAAASELFGAVSVEVGVSL